MNDECIYLLLAISPTAVTAVFLPTDDDWV